MEEGGKKEVGQQVKLQPWTSRELMLLLQGCPWKNPVKTGPAGKRGPRELVDIQR